MSIGDSRVLRERNPPNLLPGGYHSSSLQMPHKLPQAYSVVDGFYPMSETSGDYNSPGSSSWYDGGSTEYGESEYGQGEPRYTGNMPQVSYGRGTPSTPGRSDVSIGVPHYPGAPQWSRTTNTPRSTSRRPKKTKNNSIMPGDGPVPIMSINCEEPIREIEVFVNRSTQTRRKEHGGKDKQPPRPMNNFMLYRKAFQEKAKQVSSQKNHQIVSQVVAKSWKAEAKEVRERFAKLAQTEKENHLLAFPGYQFRPNKANKGRKRKAGDSDGDDTSELDDPDYLATGDIKRQRQSAPSSVPSNPTPEPQYEYPEYNQDYEYHSGYQAAYPGHRGYDLNSVNWAHPASYAVGAQFTTQELRPNSELSGLPGGGRVLDSDTHFDNRVFDSSALHYTQHTSTNFLPSFSQADYSSYDVPQPWRTSQASLEGKTLIGDYQPHIVDSTEGYSFDRR